MIHWILLLLTAPLTLAAQPAARRPMKLDDVTRIRSVNDPQCAPDGKSAVYTVSTIDAKEDKSLTHVWLATYDGQLNRQLTFSGEGESSPRWSPDGKWISFTSSRPSPVKTKGSQLWLLPSSGGEASQLTELKGRLQSYEWSPDSKRIAMVIGDPDPDAQPDDAPATAKPKTPRPIVIDRYHYKQDVEGYLLSSRHSYIYIFDLAMAKLERLTAGKWDETAPSWSPDGSRIAFLSNHDADPDRDPASRLFVAEAKAGAAEKQLAARASRGGRSRPEWSPDGKWIAFLESDEKKWGAYNMDHLALVQSDASTGPNRLQAVEGLDRGVAAPRFTADGKSIEFLVTDDQSVYPARARVDGSNVERLMASPIVLSSISKAGGCHLAITGGDSKPGEVYALDGGAVRQLSHQNDDLFAELNPGETQEVKFKSKDGTEVHGLLTTPPGYVKGTRAPLLLRIHGGPNGQDAHSFNSERHLFAGEGYAVLNVNYRGSAGRGQKFSRSIFADWGHFEVEDLIAGVDHVIKMGVADPDRLGVGGWSYGGILTDYLIASDTRFKAATSGAGTAFTVSFYGTDQYIIQYDHEIGPPWNPKSWETYVKLSYPFLHADRIKTPTLFMGGERDFNVPIEGSQQMYQALRSLEVDTMLVIYPNEFHGLQRPSYQKDRMERYLAWYAKHILKKQPPVATSTAEVQ